MGRWQPDARGRLAKAAYELYAEQGYAQTTGAEIAQRAGMHERSVFRLFGDKRDVPFHGMDEVAADFAAVIQDAPAGSTAIEWAQLAVEARCRLMQQHPQHIRLRRTVVLSSAELRERDLAKHAELAAVIATAIRRRGASPAAAKLAAEACMVAFRVSVERWASDPSPGDLVETFRSTLGELTAVLTDRTTVATNGEGRRSLAP